MRKYGRGLGSGWHYCSHEHRLARFGVKTKRNIDYSGLDLERYSGRWNQIASVPAFFQSGCRKSTAEYKPNPDGSIRVVNSCVNSKGKKSTVEGSAKVVGKDKLAVSFAPLKLDNLFDSPNYKILYTDYKVSVVGTPDKRYLWILSRSSKISRKRYDELVSIAKNRGYDVSKLHIDYSKSKPFKYASVRAIGFTVGKPQDVKIAAEPVSLVLAQQVLGKNGRKGRIYKYKGMVQLNKSERLSAMQSIKGVSRRFTSSGLPLNGHSRIVLTSPDKAYRIKYNGVSPYGRYINPSIVK